MPRHRILTDEERYLHDKEASNRWTKKDRVAHPEKYIARNKASKRKQYAKIRAFLDSKICACCGTSSAISFDHITPIIRKKQISTQRIWIDYNQNPSVFQFLCAPCNKSKQAGTTCRMHNKYLGIWNRLPQLFDIDPTPVTRLNQWIVSPIK